MPAYQTPVDIANRALQHCGAKRIGSAGFNEISVGASETAFCYDKLRESELQSNLWTFAIKRVALRAIDTNTMLLQPSLWAPATIYYRGSIVADANNNIWVSRIPNNIGNDPLLTSYWEPYFGPMSVPLYDVTGQTSYLPGELAYTTPGDGTYRVFLNLVTNNQDNPLVETVWLSTATYFKSQVVTFYPLWSNATTYALGAIVTYQGVSYVSTAAGNLNNLPSAGSPWMALTLTTSNEVAASEWNSTTAYATGTVIDYSGTLYLATVPSTGLIPPQNAGNWAAMTGGVAYQSLIDVNTNNEPDLSPTAWSATTTYSTGQFACGSDGYIYQSTANSNLNNNPIIDNGSHWTNTRVLCAWTSSFVGGSGSMNWLEIGGPEFPSGAALVRLNPAYPVGAGPASQTFSNNVFRLPNSYLRHAPDDPKKATRILGGPSGDNYDDWLFENDFLITFQTGPIMLRFVSSITDVRQMHAMFCEGLAGRIGLEVCEKVTQSTAKVQTIAKIYDSWIGKAKIVNAIDAGYTDPPDDEFVSVRA